MCVSVDAVLEREVIVPVGSEEALSQLAAYRNKHGLPGVIEPLDTEMLQYHETALVVSSEDELDQWVRATHPYQIELLGGVHEHGAAPGISDAIRYVVLRANGAEGVIGGAKPGEISPAARGWSVWVRYYPNGRTIFERPSGDKDLFPGRPYNILLPQRRGLPPATGSTLPHQQLTELSPPDIRAQMRQWMDTSFDFVRTGPSMVSDHVTHAMHLKGVPLGNKARILTPFPGATEFAHQHVDGSWHLSLPAEDRWEVLVKGWGAIHPVAKFGVNAIMFYAPRNANEMALLKEAVILSYRYARGEVF
ncbi:luciferase family protein [Sphingobium sp.]|uniref:luciferase domain-containing protein n=1 Tax=Sphingobium sp. TaxID=1912891 RepID=UPI0028BDC2E1|nr:luciferase family protein [Sphingobium sp.]